MALHCRNDKDKYNHNINRNLYRQETFLVFSSQISLGLKTFVSICMFERLCIAGTTKTSTTTTSTATFTGKRHFLFSHVFSSQISLGLNSLYRFACLSLHCRNDTNINRNLYRQETFLVFSHHKAVIVLHV